MIFDGELKSPTDEKNVVFNNQLLVFLMKISSLIIFTSFNQDRHEQSIESLKICQSILEDFVIN